MPFTEPLVLLISESGRFARQSRSAHHHAMTTVESYLQFARAIGVSLSAVVFCVALFVFGYNRFSRISRKRPDRDIDGPL